jgi:methylmalonyl-CoA mutase
MTELSLAADFPQPTREDWLSRVNAVLKGGSYAEKLLWKTGDGSAMEALYGQQDGPRAERPVVAPWKVFQRVDHPDATKANAQALDDLENGATGLSLILRDAASARGMGFEPARLGRVLQDVQLHAIALRVEGSGSEALAALIGRQPIDPERIDVSFAAPSAAIAKRLAAQGFAGPLMEACGRPWHEKGATDAQELGAVLGQAVGHLRALERLDAARLSRAVGVTLAADQDMFATLAKFRAMRLLWARMLEAGRLPAAALRLHGETSWRMQASLDPHTNILRATAALFGAGLGGTDSFTVLPFSLAQGLPNGFARRVARNVQTVLLEESNLWRVVDPASGSGYVERLTEELCAAAWSVFQATERGEWPKPDAASTRSLPVIGTSAYRLPTEHLPETEAL